MECDASVERHSFKPDVEPIGVRAPMRSQHKDGRVRYAVATGGAASWRLGASAPPLVRPTNHDQRRLF
jgi:hypothetical protein